MPKEDVDKLFGDLKNPAAKKGIASILADHVTSLVQDYDLRWESRKGDAFTFGRETPSRMAGRR